MQNTVYLFKQSGKSDDAKKTLNALNNQRWERWVKMVEDRDLKYSIRKAWCLFRRLGSDGSRLPNILNINPSFIANRIIESSRAPSHKQFAKDTKKKTF